MTVYRKAESRPRSFWKHNPDRSHFSCRLQLLQDIMGRFIPHVLVLICAWGGAVRAVTDPRIQCRKLRRLEASNGVLTRVETYTIPDLFSATIDEVQLGLDCGIFTSVQLTKTYLARIAEVNPLLHAVIETNPDALAIAADMDAKRAAGHVISPLHGLPILVKDNIATFDKMNTTAGSYALLGAKVPEDSTMAAMLRKAGAIILGKSRTMSSRTIEEMLTISHRQN
jgi:hypothetical protein